MTNENNEATTNHANDRRLAADRLRQLAALQFRRQRRRRAGGAPWRDPRNGQGRVLSVLKLKPEMTQRELTYLLGMSRQSIAELLRKLEAQGLVERETSATDRRVVNVRLTETGRNAVQDTEPEADAYLTFLDCLSDVEVTRLADYLGRIIRALEEEAVNDCGEHAEHPEEFRHHHGRGRHKRGGPAGFPPDGFPPEGFPPKGFPPGGFPPEGFPGPDGPWPDGPWGEGFGRGGRGRRGGRPMAPPPPQDTYSADDFGAPEF